MSITFVDAADLGDVAGMLRRLADKREAELADWPILEARDGKQYVANLREAADFHERQATKRRD